MGFPDLEGTTATKVADAAALEANQFKAVDVFSQGLAVFSDPLASLTLTAPMEPDAFILT
ncbi:hypothetical protein COLO4_20902 [Corchorus olitorius]|uniref:Uncharacterized protein n=1 Tax=Corchorus olitorius TaxID=93759 RepID=A0A1R3IW80_9ROSI|nr:hypothetical protein COLO4_20902 [Corchorus olitorius]